MTGPGEPVEVEALRHIADGLSTPQRRALWHSVVADPESDRPILCGAGAHTERVLKQGAAPLVAQDGMVRYLTPLGVRVGRFLHEHGGLPTG